MRSPNKFWDRIADRYAKKPVADPEAYERKLAITRDYLRSDTEVLEFGCGTGSTALVHAPSVGHIQAIDISSRMIEIAREKVSAAGVDNVIFDQGTIEEFEAAAESYDVILGLSILHLLENKEDVILKVHNLLKPGGVFVSSTACLGETMKYFKLIAPIGKLLGLFPLVRVFTRQNLERSITDAGFMLDDVWQTGKERTVFIVAKKIV